MIKFVEKLLSWSRSGRDLSPVATWIGLIICLIFAVGLRLIVWHFEPTLSRDGVNYVQVAQEIRQRRDGRDAGKSFLPVMATSHYLYSSYLALAPAGIPPQAFGVWTNIFLGSLIPLILGCTAWLLWGRGDLAVGCAALFAVFPKFVEWSGEVQRETPLLFFAGCFLLFLLLYGRKPRWYWSIAVGVALAMGFVCRYEGAEFFLIWAAALAWLAWKHPTFLIVRHGILSILAGGAVIALVFWLIGVPPSDFLRSAWQKIHGFIV